MTALGDDHGFDAANASGECRDNALFKNLHTQDPRGNMDDRFDFQFVSGELLDDVGLDYIDGSFSVFGNDGTHLMGRRSAVVQGRPRWSLLRCRTTAMICRSWWIILFLWLVNRLVQRAWLPRL